MNEDSIFFEALQKGSAEARAAFLNQACAGNAELRESVEQLLRAHAKAENVLYERAPGLFVTVAPSVTERIGTQIGPYKLLQQIGEGGFGVVFMAEQTEPVRRHVALKVIKPGMDTRQVIARFEAERQALAVMDHPNIARVIDAGTSESGRPYFVMELVRGTPITQYCDENSLTIRERLGLFTSICQAIQHAHTKGIIHRDIKPTNVLVTRQDGQPVVKVIDFGIAKALGQQLTDKTLFTDFAQMIGTPLYMSPEQAELSSTDIDTRSDIYSLGVLLYELMTGSTPVSKEQFKQAAFDEIRRIIREDEAQRPSNRISTAEAAPSIAAQRHTEPAKLAKLVRGELDWIVMKALEKDRSRRYETASGFARDIERYLHDEPVQACPPSAVYRFGKFARRNRGALWTASVVGAALVIGTVVSTWLAIRANSAERLARQRLVKEQIALNDANLARQDTARELSRAVKAEEQAQSARHDAESNLVKARQAVQQMLTRVAEERLAYIPQVEEVRSKLLEDALRFYEELLQQKDVDPAIRLEAALARLRVGNLARVLGRHSEAEEHCRVAVTIMQRLGREQPENEQFQVVLSDAYQGLGQVLATGNASLRTNEAEQALKESIRIQSDLAVRSPKVPNHRQRQSVSYRWLALALRREPSRQLDAAAACRNAIEISQKLVSEFPSSPDYLVGLASAHLTLCRVLDKVQPEATREHAQAAVTLFERLESASSDTPATLGRELGTTHQGLAAYRHDFASAYLRLGECFAKVDDREQASAAFRKGLAIYERLVTDFPSVPLYRTNLAGNLTKWSTFLEAGGDEGGAEDASRRAVDLYGGLVQQFPTNESYQRSLIQFLYRRGASSESLAVVSRIRVSLDAIPDKRASQKAYKLLIVTLLDVARRPADAEAICREQIALAEKLVAESGGSPSDLREWGDLLYSLGRAQLRQSRLPEASEVFRQNVVVFERLVAATVGNPDDRSRLEDAYSILGWTLKLRGSNDEAITSHRKALALAETLAAEFPQEPKYSDRRADNHCELADLLRTIGQLDQAQQHYEQVVDFYKTQPERSDSLRIWGLTLIGLAHVFSERGEHDRAGEAYQQVLKIKPDDVIANDDLAWLLATCAEPQLRNPAWAIEFATRAVKLFPQFRWYWVTLGAAQYRAGNWNAASEAFEKSTALDQGGDAFVWFFQAMVHWQLDEKEEARRWYDKAVEWMDQNAKNNDQLIRFRAEAEALLGVK